MEQKNLTDSESLSLNIEATCLLLSSPRNFQYEIIMDKYRPYPSMISMFTSDSQHPPRSRQAVHLGDEPARCFNESFCKTLFHAIWLLITCDKGSDEPAQMCILNTAFSTQRDTHPSQHTMSGHYRPASEMPSKWRFAGGPVVARF